MSERSPEQIAKDLLDGLRAVENKTIDAVPWYQAEAMAGEIAALRKRVEELVQTFAHYHVASRLDVNGSSTLLDSCAKCRLDLRDPIHAALAKPEAT